MNHSDGTVLLSAFTRYQRDLIGIWERNRMVNERTDPKPRPEGYRETSRQTKSLELVGLWGNIQNDIAKIRIRRSE